ncbi:hypothetical protein [Alteromonas halophila]|uniref:Uncharacterized protein n=1 Tax=Alteromonas halophila TaxID=516698 RepID=A0A918JJ62_9ALTE|nr:hypothetical protein [Alteromonas halophila]GGW83648.1 hypothetical protein GCM10007391_16530 [Alteromonas halophila]
MTKTNFDDALKQQLDTLPEEKHPERDLWRGVALALENEADTSTAKPGWRSGWAAMAASVALIAMVSWYSLQQPSGPTEPSAITGEALVQALSQQHEQQKQALLVEYTDTPALADNWQQQLDELDDAAAAIKAALAEDPDNPALLRMLQNVYQQQITLIERVHAPKWQRI